MPCYRVPHPFTVFLGEGRERRRERRIWREDRGEQGRGKEWGERKEERGRTGKKKGDENKGGVLPQHFTPVRTSCSGLRWCTEPLQFTFLAHLQRAIIDNQAVAPFAFIILKQTARGFDPNSTIRVSSVSY